MIIVPISFAEKETKNLHCQTVILFRHNIFVSYRTLVNNIILDLSHEFSISSTWTWDDRESVKI